MNKPNFFDACVIPTSLFNIDYAKSGGDPGWQDLEECYNTNYLEDFSPVENPIPKKIHFIWLGGPLPDIYNSNIQDWKNKNPNFEVILWNDESVAEFDMENRDLFEKAPSWGNKSDILRYEILNKYGGLYADTDFLCTDSFDEVHENLSFYAGVCLEKPPQMNNGIMASVPGHPILKSCIKNITLDNPWNLACKATLVLYQTGPWHLTTQILSHIITNKKDIVLFPSQFFHPFPAVYRHEANEELISSFLKPHTKAVHLWHTSWQEGSKYYCNPL